MFTHSRTLAARYFFAFVTVVVTTVLRFLLSPILGTGVPFILYYPTIVLCSWFGGFGAGLFSTVFGALVAWYVFFSVPFSFERLNSTEIAQLITFLFAGILISFLAESMHRARRKAEESEAQERERREELRITLASIGDAVIATDAESKVTFMNAVAETLTGESQAEAIGKPLERVFRIIREDTRQVAENPVTKVLEKGHIVGLANHTVLIAKDGTERPIDDSAAPIRDKNGKLIGVILVFRDITARRREEATQSYLSAIVESSNDAIISKTLDQIITSWNKAAENIFGYTQAEMIGQSIYKLIPPGRHKEEERIIERLKRGQKIEHYETVRVRKDGTLIDVALTISPIKNQEGQIIGASKIVHDITERKLFQKKLQEIVRRHEETLASITDGFYICDRELRYQYMNNAGVKMAGKSRAELIGKTIFEVYPDLKGSMIEIEFNRAIRENIPVHFEVYYPPYDRWFEHHAYPSDDGLTIYVTDTTSQRRLLQSLRESEAYFRGLADAMPQLVWTARSNGTVEYYNSRAREYDGLAPKEDGTWEWEAIVHKDDLEMTIQAWQSAVQTGNQYECEHRIKLTDGTFRWHLSRALPIKDESGQVLKWFGTATDIHELRQKEQELRENDRRKDEFLAMLAHELRNPLAPILNAARVLRYVAPNVPEIEQMRDMIERQTQHLARLVDDLLDVSRITRGKITLQHERLELKTVITRAIETSRPLIDASRHRLTVTLPQEQIYIKGDLTRLAQVISNLLNNAAKYTEEGGKIELSAERNGGKIIIRVKDNGVGIPANALPHIFDLFSQADRSLDRSQGGLGIGLTLVKSLVEMHGGQVEAHSEGFNQGSEFIVHLPIVIDQQQESREPSAITTPSNGGRASTNHHNFRVLVVDDNIDSAESMALFLNFGGHEVRVAHDGPEALQVAREFHPQIVLLDIGLPGMDGYEVAQGLREDQPLPETVIIAMTGYGQAEDRQRSKESGFDHHLTKPVDHDTLSSIINSLKFD